MKEKNLSINKLITICIIFFLFKKVNVLYFNYPTAVTLKNGNIFIIHQSGITIVDANFTKVIKNVTEDELVPNTHILSKVNIRKFDNGYLLCSINNQLYIFNSEGERNFNMNLLIDNNQDIYYTLTPHKIENGDLFYYLVSYIYNNSLYLYYYKYISHNNSNFLVASKDNFKDDYTIKNKGLSCEFLVFRENEEDEFESITCSYYTEFNSSQYLSVAILITKEKSINRSRLNFEHYLSENINCIKSIKTEENATSFGCFYDSFGPFCYFYDVNVYLEDYWEFYDYCRNEFYALKVDYFPEKKEYVFSCLTSDGGIISFFFDKYFNILSNSSYELRNCEYLYGYSILYSNITNNYYILSDSKCKGVEKPLEMMTFEEYELEEV